MTLVACIIPKHIWESVPVADWRTDPGATGQDPSRVVGSGPFKFQEWRQGESVTLVRNDDYYGKVPYLDSYVDPHLAGPDCRRQRAAQRRDRRRRRSSRPTSPPSRARPASASSTIPPAASPSTCSISIPEVTTKWQDQRVRQALLYALDRESIVNDILLGYAEVAQGTQPVISYAYAPDRITTKYTYDPEKAKALLAEAGWTDTRRRRHRRQGRARRSPSS